MVLKQAIVLVNPPTVDSGPLSCSEHVPHRITATKHVESFPIVFFRRAKYIRVSISLCSGRQRQTGQHDLYDTELDMLETIRRRGLVIAVNLRVVYLLVRSTTKLA